MFKHLKAVGLVVVLVCCVAWPGGAHAAEVEPAWQLTLAGNDQVLWIVSGERDLEQKQFLQYLRYRPALTERILVPEDVSAQLGEIRRAAVVGARLHLFFRGDDRGGAHYSYGWSGWQRELRLPGGVIPEAVAGDMSSRGRRLWAIVSAKTADVVEARWQRTVRERLAARQRRVATAPVETRPAPVLPDVAAARTPGTYYLVQYDGSDWRPGFALTSEYVAGEQTWLAIAADRCHLLWQQSLNDTRIQHARREGEGWTVEPPLDLGARPQGATARLATEGDDVLLLFAMLGGDGGDPNLLRCRAWKWLAGEEDASDRGWSALPVLKSADGQEVRVPAGAVIASFEDAAGERERRQAWAILSRSDAGVEVGMWSLSGGEPIRPPMAVAMDGSEGGSQEQQNVREMVGLVIVFVLLMLVFWRRQDSLAQPISLPPGYAVAPLSKRVVAFLIDLLPAIGLVWWIWHDDIRAYSDEINEWWALGIQRPPEMPVKLLWIGFYFRLIYAGYCMLFEMINFSTPGKRLMGCEVFSESLTQPNAVQVIIRNLSRILELETYLLVAWPFLLVVFFTRNRQRFGDLIAKTLIVERQEVLSDTPSGLDDSGSED
jgi:uncharacterized RDD family membrane protein YckC